MATLVKDPITGTFSSNSDPTGTGRTMVDLNGGMASPSQGVATTAATPSGTNPYTLFNLNVAQILKQIQGAQTAGMTALGGAQDALKTTSVTSSPYDASMTPTANISTMGSMPSAFNPAITSIATQEANTGAALGNLKDSLSTMASIFQPVQVAPGSSLVTPQGGVIKTGHQYSPQMNPNTGLLDGFDITTGTWASDDNHGQSSSSVVGGVDFSGQATSTGAYATDPKYAAEVGGIYNTLTSTYPMPTADTIATYIAGHAKSSPVTGQMIMNAASQYGIDPNLLTSVLAHESDFGTAGAATTTYNPGNVGNTDDGSRRAYKSWQQGVNAAANELARRLVPAGTTAGTNQPATATSNIGGQFSPTASAKVAAMPGPMQSYVDAGPNGVAYINNDRVPANLQDTMKIMASRAGIPYVQGSDAAALRSIQAVYDQLDNMEGIIDKNLSNGWGNSTIGHIIDSTSGQAAKFFQTEHGQQLNRIDSFRDTAIKAVQGLAGGAGSGLRINMGEIDANVQNLPTSGDSLQAAKTKLTNMRNFLNIQLSTTFPYSLTEKGPTSPTAAVPTQVTAGGRVYSFPDAASAAQFKAAAGIQ